MPTPKAPAPIERIDINGNTGAPPVSALDTARENAAVRHQVSQGRNEDNAVRRFEERYRWYRERWDAPMQALVERRDERTGHLKLNIPPLCIDIEVAAICDLACPFCFRQHIVTPDKIIDADLCHRLIDQAAELGVPSIKFNWRGEPLLHPRLAEFVGHAKRAGIVETIINTNATHLTPDVARALIENGLDLMIYSFDGGSARSYEKMRPGRFEPNRFEAVLENIRNFAALRKSMNRLLPRTKIQMILTEETFEEQDAFHALFRDHVDEVTVKQYTERGAGLSDLPPDVRARLSQGLGARGLPLDTAYLRDMRGEMFVATGRRPCKQPFQRLLVTYDGRVGMCCYDWGAMHPVGYVAADAFEHGNADFDQVMAKARAGRPGFEMMRAAAPPAVYNQPEKIVQDLGEIWSGAEVNAIRLAHWQGAADLAEVCRHCTFKETYQWEKL